jgi:NADPH:quinone reductase-like Zn-dependent oxidoreductase
MRIRKMAVLALVAFMMMAGQIAVAVEGQEAQKAVLVTGASSGIGLKVTEYLSDAGYFVYAGARKEKDLERLRKISTRRWKQLPRKGAASTDW